MLTAIGIATLYTVLCPAYFALGYNLGKNWNILTNKEQ